ncbi:MAG: hypothetical protein AAFV19_07805 [Pseudomonadota bacterium]
MTFIDRVQKFRPGRITLPTFPKLRSLPANGALALSAVLIWAAVYIVYIR